MKEMARMIVLAAVVYSTACVPSLNPFCSEADSYLDQNLLGTWSDAEGGETWTFVHADDSHYLFTYTDDTGKTGAFRARLFKVGDRSFLDVEPVRPRTKQNSFYSEHLLSLHSVYLISITGNKARLAFLDPAWLEATLKKDPTILTHAIVDDEIVLTDTTEKLQAFLLASATTPDAFVMSEPLERKK